MPSWATTIADGVVGVRSEGGLSLARFDGPRSRKLLNGDILWCVRCTESLTLMFSDATAALRSRAVSMTGGFGFRRNLGILSMTAREEILVALAAAFLTALAKKTTKRAGLAVAVAVAVDLDFGFRSLAGLVGESGDREK